MPHLATITTQSHLPHTLALRESVFEHATDIHFAVLITDAEVIPIDVPENTSFYTLKSIAAISPASQLIKKYASNNDKLRWTLKPVFIKYLLTQTNASKVIYTDNDIFFTAPFSFLFDMLDTNEVLLCPHWRCSTPALNKDWFLVNFTDGLYNAGFFGASSGAIPALDWWAQACLFKCAKTYRKGLFDDQKYLDMMPLLFENTAIIRHQGCNVAYWNQHENLRTLSNGQVRINDAYDIVFIHFTRELIKSIKSKKDPLLQPYLEKYMLTLQKFRTSS